VRACVAVSPRTNNTSTNIDHLKDAFPFLLASESPHALERYRERHIPLYEWIYVALLLRCCYNSWYYYDCAHISHTFVNHVALLLVVVVSEPHSTMREAALRMRFITAKPSCASEIPSTMMRCT